MRGGCRWTLGRRSVFAAETAGQETVLELACGSTRDRQAQRTMKMTPVIRKDIMRRWRPSTARRGNEEGESGGWLFGESDFEREARKLSG